MVLEKQVLNVDTELNMKKILYSIIFATLILSSCSKDDNSFSDTPKIGFNKIYPASVQEFKDKFFIEISYKDGNGDLGSSNPDETNIIVTDKRMGLDYKFRLRDLSTPNGNPNIEGVFVIEMPPTAIVDDNNTEESVSFDVVLTDQSGETSNIVSTSSITVLR
jgi:hypothetical protein